MADLEAFLGGLVEPARVYIVEQGEDSVDLVSGCTVEGLEDFSDLLLGDSLQRVGWTLELLRCDFGSEFVFEFHRMELGRVLRPRGSWKEFKLLRLRNGFAARGQADFGGGYSDGAASGPGVGSWNAVRQAGKLVGKPPRATLERRSKAECEMLKGRAKPPRATLKRGTGQVHARHKPGASQGIGRR